MRGTTLPHKGLIEKLIAPVPGAHACTESTTQQERKEPGDVRYLSVIMDKKMDENHSSSTGKGVSKAESRRPFLSHLHRPSAPSLDAVRYSPGVVPAAYEGSLLQQRGEAHTNKPSSVTVRRPLHIPASRGAPPSPEAAPRVTFMRKIPPDEVKQGFKPTKRFILSVSMESSSSSGANKVRRLKTRPSSSTADLTDKPANSGRVHSGTCVGSSMWLGGGKLCPAEEVVDLEKANLTGTILVTTTTSGDSGSSKVSPVSSLTSIGSREMVQRSSPM